MEHNFYQMWRLFVVSLKFREDLQPCQRTDQGVTAWVVAVVHEKLSAKQQGMAIVFGQVRKQHDLWFPQLH